MKSFSIQPILLIMFFAVLLVCALAALFVLPVLLINCGWDALIAAHTDLPVINFWQSALLYAAFLSVMYITGLVKVEFSIEQIDEFKNKIQK